MTAEQFGAFVRVQREQHGGTAKEFAQTLGFSPQYVNDIERGRRTPAGPFLSAFAKTCGLRESAVYALCGRIGEGWRPTSYESALRAMDAYLRDL